MAPGRPTAPGSRAAVERAVTSLVTVMAVERAPGGIAAAATSVVALPATISPGRSEARTSMVELMMDLLVAPEKMTASHYPTLTEVNTAAEVMEFLLVVVAALEREVETAAMMVFVAPEREVALKTVVLFHALELPLDHLE